MPAPFIFTDELQYQENARSLAAGDGFLVRGDSYGIVSVLYPLLLVPAYALFDSLPDAYAAARTVNAVVMSLAAVPAYFLARRVLSEPGSLLAALLAVCLPSLAYTGTLMSENLFYPVTLVVAWSLVRALEEPKIARQIVLIGSCGIAGLVRVQALAFVLAALTAPLLLRVVARRSLRPWLPLYGAAVALALIAVVGQVARGASLNELFGAYAVVGEGGYDAVDVLRFLFWHLAELDLYVGVFPLAALLLLTARWRVLDPPAQAFLAATIALVTWTLVVVAAFASRFAGAIEERNMFVVVPLLLIALLVWIERGATRPRWFAIGAAALAAVLPALIPYDRFLQLKVRSDTLMIVPLWNVQDSVTLPRLDDVVLLAGLAAGAAFLLVPRRYALALPALVLAYYVLAAQPIHAGPHGMERASAEAVFEGIRVPQNDWIDRAVPEGAEVAAVWTGRTHRFTVNQNEFFNSSVGPVYTLGGPMPGGFPETAVAVDAQNGELQREDGSTIRVEYAFTDGSVALDGEPVARDEALGLTLYRVDGPLISTTSVTGVYNDQWSGPEVTYRRVRCEGGTLTVTLDSDPGLHSGPQVVEGSSGDNLVFVRLAPTESKKLRVPLASRDGVCFARFTVAPTKVAGNGDDRRLGVHFRAFEYTAP